MSHFKTFLKLFGGLFAVLTIVFAANVIVRLPFSASASTQPVCVSSGSQCGTDNGTQTTVVTDTPSYSCPSGYHLQNDGNDGQRCHRNQGCGSYPQGQCPTEHLNPTVTCPQGDTQSGSGSNITCTHTNSVTCHTGIIDYSACTPAQTCSTACGQPATQVPNGHGGFTQCAATSACVTPVLDCDGDTDGSTPNGDDEECAEVKPTPVLDCDGDTDGSNPNEDDVCVTPTATPTPTVVQTNNGGGSSDGGDGLGCATHDCSGNQVGGGSTSGQVLGASTGPTQAVLGASTMAGTGTFDTSIMNFMLTLGTIIFGAGIRSYAKEKKN